MCKPIFTLLALVLLGSGCNFNAPSESFIRVQGSDGQIVNYAFQNGAFKHSPTASLGVLSNSLISSPAAHFNLSVSVADYDNDIRRVELLANNAVISQRQSAPYTFNTSLLTANGNYYLQIRVVDAAGLTGVSESRELSVSINNGVIEENPKLQIRLGDRHYVGSILEQIFGSSDPYWDFEGQSSVAGVVSAPIANRPVRDILESEVFTRYLLFGGVCDHNQSGRFRSGSNYIEFRRENCHGSNLSDTTRIDRESQILKVCRRLTLLDSALSHAAGLVGGDINSNPTASQIQQSFELFYPNVAYDAEIAASLTAVPGTRGTAKEKWRILLEGLCQSSYWQVID